MSVLGVDDHTLSRAATVISSQAAMYGDADVGLLQPVPGSEADCTVFVKYDDGAVDTVSAATTPTPRIEQAAMMLFYGTLACAIATDTDGDAWESAQEHHDYLIGELMLTGDERGIRVPASGEYWGRSEENDEGDQAVRSTLNFHKDGSITGHGLDGEDGAYRISKGRWGVLDGGAQPTVAWIETYDEGFKAAVKGHYNARDGKIKARFVSSRGVRGTCVLAPKPNMFRESSKHSVVAQ